jgi:monoamine oxidase
VIDVAVIGAGAAGVGAARRLHDAGLQVLLIEARSRLGGRGLTAETTIGGPLDLGCGWLHSGDQNPWTWIAERQGRTIDRSPAPWSKSSAAPNYPADEQRAFRAASERFQQRIAEAAERPVDSAASAALEPENRWNGLLQAVSTYVSGTELERVSARDLTAYSDSGVNWRVVEGYGATIAAHAAGTPLALDCPVSRIDHRDRLLRIETPKGVIEAEKAIVTLPTSLIAAEAIAFDPPLPAKVEAAHGLPLGLADKLFLTFEGAADFGPDSRAFGRTDRAETGAYHLRPFGRPLIEAYFGGSFAADLEKAGEAAFFAFATDELRGLFGADFAGRLRPLPMNLWAADPYARGSYSCALPGRAQDRLTLAEPVGDRLFFAGEACSPHDFSTAHGALATGLAAAERVLALAGRRQTGAAALEI